uniref:Uncharacterized protein n=1 Tax=Daucus carota subsp. sativus TaxID=79200 RepID=A0A161WUR8_DAUCS
MNDHEASTSGTKNKIELTQFPFWQQKNDHEASTSGTKNMYYENYSDSDEDFDRYSYVYEIDENVEGQVISSSPSNVQVPTPPVNIPPPSAHIISPPNHYSFLVLYSDLLLNDHLAISLYVDCAHSEYIYKVHCYSITPC